jgi:hypothetical protein
MRVNMIQLCGFVHSKAFSVPSNTYVLVSSNLEKEWCASTVQEKLAMQTANTNRSCNDSGGRLGTRERLAMSDVSGAER